MTAINLRLLIRSMLVVCLSVSTLSISAQTVIAERTNYGAGFTQYIWNAYTGAGDVTNSYEFVPAGFNPNDPTVKYPVIFFFPGVGDVKTSDPNSVLRLGLRAIAIELEGGNFGPGNFNFIVIGMQGSASSPANEYAAFMENYAFVKFQNKIDFSRVYLTGLSMGGGRIMEYMENATRAAKIAAIAPVATGTGCPYIAGCGPGSAYFTIINNLTANTSLGMFFTHNILDPTVDYEVSQGYVDGVNATQPNRAQFYFDPTNPNHDAWSTAYASGNRNFGNKNMYDWLLQYSLNITLPVTLTSFTASLTASKTVNLRWATAGETNSAYFAVEKSANGKDYTEIGRVTAAGNSSTSRSYQFSDAQPAVGGNYYRLKQVDKNNSFQYSQVKKISLNNLGLSLQAGPNPFSNQVELLISGDARVALTANVSDVNGKLLRQVKFMKNETSMKKMIDLSNLSSGVYILQVNGDGVSFVQKLIKN
jgi:hypothetical protein